MSSSTATRPAPTRPAPPRSTSRTTAVPLEPAHRSRPSGSVRSTASPRSRRVAPRPAAGRSGGLRLTTRGYLLVLLVLVLLLLAAFAVGRSASSQAVEQPTATAPTLTQVTVQPGDTLWSIARQVAPRRDPRDVVTQIRRLNHLTTAAVQAGRQLLLPVAV